MPTRTQTSATNLSVSGNPLVLTLASAPAVGSRVVFFVSTSGSPWAAVPAGATLDAHVDDAGRFTDIYSREVVAGDGLSFTFTPTGASAACRGFAIVLAPETSGSQIVLRAAVASDAASDVTRSVNPPASAVSGSLYGVAVVGLGGTSGGADAVSAPWTTLTPPGPFDSGRMHMARYAMTGTDLPAATFTWATARRAGAVAAVYGEAAPADPDVTLPAASSPLDTVLISQPAATSGTAPIVYTITEVTAGGVVIDEHEEFYARPHGSDGRTWVVPQAEVETYWRVTATSSTGKTAAQTYDVPPVGTSGAAGTPVLYGIEQRADGLYDLQTGQLYVP